MAAVFVCAVGEAVSDALVRMRLCYVRELTATPNLAGEVAVTFVIDSRGMAAQAQVSSTTVESEDIQRCVIGKVMRMQFPTSDDGSTGSAEYRFEFSPR